jgi:ribosome recycling factor
MTNVKKETQKELSKAIESLKITLAKIRTGRAHPSLLDSVIVEHQNTKSPLKQMATIVVEDARTLKVVAFDPKSVGAITKSILNAGLGLNPSNTGTNIYVPLPALTEETRKMYIKQLRQNIESARIVVRNLRRDAFTAYKKQLKNKEINENDEKRLSNSIQKDVDETMAIIDGLLTQKEKEIMAI